MRLPNTAHTSRPWRIHELTRDFRLEDVWALPTPGGPDDFPRLVQLIASGDPSKGSSRAARTLWAIRWKVGELLGWDRSDAGYGLKRPTLRNRLPADLRDRPSGPDFDTLPFVPLYLLDDEWAAEIANRTMHGVMHIGWGPDPIGGYRGEMAVYVRPNGLLGTTYMAAIRPFRHRIVYPSIMREIERAWHGTDRGPGMGSAVTDGNHASPAERAYSTVDEHAPVVGSAEILISADPETVWDVLAAIDGWPAWNPDVKWVSIEGDITEGTQFRWKSGPGTLTSTLRRLERPSLIAWTGRTFGIDAVHVWRFEPRNGGAFVRTEESFDGVVARLFRRPLRKTLAGALEGGLRHLKAEAERRAGR